MGPVKTVVTGGVRSGKSSHAERLLGEHGSVVYLAPGPPVDPAADPEWARRVAAHRARRPEKWRTVEGADVAGLLPGLQGAVLLDCLGTWLTGQLDAVDAWGDAAGWEAEIERRIAALAAAWAAYPSDAVAVTNEVGWGLVSEHRSGRIFADWLGRTNQAIAAASDDVWLVVAGRTLRL
ncbi:bifunctional adenosylcobinamide kinase/adenosylcobinamide-phosphate guanylyltransferase [Naumannella sp. ID2617S]|nr:bifunctional adenosylcobinamide kinase/adenosylcobinamide-phosphate guanylyltransferase [Naumannella sp. ID2617S]